MRAVLLCFLFLFLLATSCSNNTGHPKNEKKVFVWAVNGLMLKLKPDTLAENITNIPYGRSVTIVQNDEPPVIMNSKIYGFLSVYKLQGKWVKVLYNGKEGYLFDGYLSAMPPFNISVESAEEYLKRIYGVARITKVGGKYDMEKTTTYYKNGNVSIETIYDGCFDTEMNLKNITYREAVLLMGAISSDDGFPIVDLKITDTANRVNISYNVCT